MTAILIRGYKSFELGIFNGKDKHIRIIKKAIKAQLKAQLEEGLEWLVFTGDLGFEVWVLEVAKELQKDYPFKIATLFDFESHGLNWNEKNQEKLQAFKEVDFVKYSFKSYESPKQFQLYNSFLLDKTDGAYLFYDEEKETNLKYLLKQMKEKKDYQLTFLTFERLNEIIEEE
ncbi:DUF1273 domain-containing protein [Streptococcus catagoni]|uniref:DUF1273 domain-containing protein n=1 Tax=Streptococcus catagoni TaxID=2654874 RepID=UPI001408F179|nr:DUF1273 domain-containing protein [Streptococcus catagoni]